MLILSDIECLVGRGGELVQESLSDALMSECVELGYEGGALVGELAAENGKWMG